MSRRGLQALAAAALICATAPSAAFDNLDSISQPSQGVTFYVSIPLGARVPKQENFSAGLLVQGKRQEHAFHVDSRMFNNFLGTGLEAKWIIAGVVAAGAAVAVAGKSKTQSNNEQQQQQQAQAAQQQGTQGGSSGGSFHPDGSPHVPGDNCACHGGAAQ